MLHVKKAQIVKAFFAISAVNSNQSKTYNRKDLYAICSYSSLQEVGYVPLPSFANRRLTYSDGLLKSPCIAHQPDGIHPVQIHLIGIRDLPDHRSVRNKEVKFI